MNISNKTLRALSIPLRGGKKLHLGPGKIGQIDAKAAEYPALKKLIEAGDVEILDSGRNTPSPSTGAFAASDSAKARAPR
ncbi:MAG: hypothetical protein ABIJ09_05880 [Pseudomonadota bacterium]